MRLILAYPGGGGGGYYPYTQKPVDYQPYRPIYMYRGPPPDLGMSYGLYEDEQTGDQFYADQGIETFSPMSGRSAKLIEEFSPEEIERLFGKDSFAEGKMENVECYHCGATYHQNIGTFMKGRNETWCHRCGGKLPFPEEKKEKE